MALSNGGYQRLSCLGISFLGVIVFSLFSFAETKTSSAAESTEPATATFAGGCFWCVETDFEKIPGVIEVVSGYTGGRSKSPTYQNYYQGGHREAVEITYDPSKITYAGLVELFIKHINPMDLSGSFVDRGKHYGPAVYFASEGEKKEAERVFEAIDAMKVFPKPIKIPMEAKSIFWPAEEYHQDYHEKNPTGYQSYRMGCGRDAYVEKTWGSRANKIEIPGGLPVTSSFPASGPEANQTPVTTEDTSRVELPGAEAASAAVEPASATEESERKQPWLSFKKPKAIELKKSLNAIQFKVTQQDGTETAFRNEYWNNKEEGIYVDIVSGEPLFLSSDKFDSGTGWPSFTKPISPKVVTTKIDRSLFSTRTEVRSVIADSHLGHVFEDGPPARGGLRYCMNSAAMRFIPKAKMAEEGYGDYLKELESNPNPH